MLLLDNRFKHIKNLRNRIMICHLTTTCGCQRVYVRAKRWRRGTTKRWRRGKQANIKKMWCAQLEINARNSLANFNDFFGFPTTVFFLKALPACFPSHKPFSSFPNLFFSLKALPASNLISLSFFLSVAIFCDRCRFRFRNLMPKF